MAPHGPMSPRNAVAAGSWFLMREAELSMALASSITLSRAGGSLKVTWHLPASKTDPQALGTSRSHGCSCPSAGPASVSCPVHVLWDQLLFLQRSFPQKFKGRRNDFNVSTRTPSLPYSPTCAAKSARRRGWSRRSSKRAGGWESRQLAERGCQATLCVPRGRKAWPGSEWTCGPSSF